MTDKTDSHGIVEEPSAQAQVEAAEAGAGVTAFIPEDEIAQFATAEQGDVAEPSAEAQEAML